MKKLLIIISLMFLGMVMYGQGTLLYADTIPKANLDTTFRYLYLTYDGNRHIDTARMYSFVVIKYFYYNDPDTTIARIKKIEDVAVDKSDIVTWKGVDYTGLDITNALMDAGDMAIIEKSALDVLTRIEE